MEFTHPSQSSDILQFLNEQRQNGNELCDVKIRLTGCTSSIYAHRCIVGTCSEYFLGLFRHDNNVNKVIETVIPGSSIDALSRIIDYMYRGTIEISEDTVEEILHLADYLGIQKLLEFCCLFLKVNLSDESCFKMAVLADIYSLKTLADDFWNYIAPRMSTLILRSNVLQLPVEILGDLLTNSETNYVREVDILNVVQSYIGSEKNPARKSNMADQLFECLEFSYLSPEVIKRVVFSNSDTVDWLRMRPETLELVRNLVTTDEKRRDFVEVIFCRCRTAQKGDEIEVMVYLIEDDTWRILKRPSLPDRISLKSLESMVTHDGFLYFLSAQMEDMYGYMHRGHEWKSFKRIHLEKGVWEILEPPVLVEDQIRLTSSERGLFAVDRLGRVECYVTDEKRWIVCCKEGFTTCPNTLCFLPMPKGPDLYLLRIFSAGFTFYFAQKSLSLWMLDASMQSWRMLSEIQMESDLFIDDEDHDVNFFGYSISPDVIRLKDELGQTRSEFDLTSSDWSVVCSNRQPPQQKMIVQRRPRFFRDIYGSTQCADRIYFVAKATTAEGENIFVMFDNVRRRFKKTEASPICLSGLLCHVTLSAKSLDLITAPSIQSNAVK